MRSIITFFGRAALLALALLAALGTAGVARAQPQVVGVEPHAGARLTASPERVRVIFSEPISGPSSLQILDIYGRAMASAGAPSPADPSALEVASPDLTPGIYTVVWSAGVEISAIKGHFAFTILSLTPADIQAEQLAVALAVESLAGHAQPSPLALLLRGAMLLGAAGAIGGWAALAAMLLPALAAHGLAPDPATARRGRRLIASMLLLTAAAAALMLIMHTIEVADRPDISILPAVALGSRYGFLLLARIALAGMLLLLLAPWSSEAPVAGWRGLSELAPPGGLMVLTFSLSSRAAAEAEPMLPVAADWLHLGAAALWLGGAAMLALLLPGVLRAQPEGARAPLAGQLFVRFTALSLVSAAALTATGLYAASGKIGAPAELWQTAYGQALLAKLAASGGLIALMAPRLPLARRRMAGWAQMGLGLVALLAAGALSGLPRPAALPTAADARAAPQAPSASAVPTYRQLDQTIAADGLTITVGVDPTLAGSSTLRVSISDSSGQAPPAIQRVQLVFERPDLNIGSIQIDAVLQPDATYKASGPLLSILGNWQMRVQVQRAAADEVEAAFTLPMVVESRPLFFCTFTAI